MNSNGGLVSTTLNPDGSVRWRGVYRRAEPGANFTPASGSVAPVSGQGENLALASRGATASQSSTYSGSCGGNPRNAIDGKTEGADAYNCRSPLSHTNIEDRPWWRVELGGNRVIGRINVWNRTDVAQARLTNFTVSAIDASGRTVFSQDLFTSGGYPNPSVTISLPGVTARTVEVRLRGRNYLNLAEVEVFGGSDGGAVKPASGSGEVWYITEANGDTLTWKRRAGSGTFDVYTKGGSLAWVSTMTISGNQVTMTRPDLGTYKGTISPDGRSASGTASWYSSGTKWTARIE
jgi:hypothetical protein